MKKTCAIVLGGLAAMAQGQVINEDAKLLATDGEAVDLFGRNSVSLSGDTAIIGAASTDDLGGASGSVYVFVRSGNAWVQQAKLLASNGVAEMGFGTCVGASGDTAVIGTSSAGFEGEKVYVFNRDGGTWMEETILTGAGAISESAFGTEVAIDGDTVVVGALADGEGGPFNATRYGAVYVFTRSEGVWTQQARLTASDREAGRLLGCAVALSGDTLVAGDIGSGGDLSGAAYIFTRSEGVWTEQAKLLADDGASGDRFGTVVSIDGDTVIIGAENNDDNGSNSGSAYVFFREEGVWTQQAKLLPSDGADSDSFGNAVSVSGDSAVIGARRDDDNGSGSGSAYLFSRSGGVWTQQAKLLPSDGSSSDGFGDAVSFSGETAVVGAGLGENGMGSATGAAYIFDFAEPPCPGDIADDFGTLGGDGTVSFGDFLALLGLVGPCPGMTPGCDGDIADDFGTVGNADGQVSFGDFLALLGLVGPCP